jgi:hypothetical protein
VMHQVDEGLNEVVLISQLYVCQEMTEGASVPSDSEVASARSAQWAGEWERRVPWFLAFCSTTDLNQCDSVYGARSLIKRFYTKGGGNSVSGRRDTRKDKDL